MVDLLDLPSELLFNIIHIVLSSPIVQSENGKRYRTSWWNTTDRNLYCVLSPDHSKRPKAVDLLLVSRKIQIETTEYLSKAPRNFEIDIAVVDDHWLWPTRRVIPVRKLDETIESLAAVPSRKIQGLAHLDFEQLYPVDRAKSERYLRGLSSYIEQWARYWSTERVGQRIGRIQFYLNEEIWKELDFESCVTDI
ncbi:unnamed protein product [Alternaria alternata]